ncbi:MAG TPA: hypothetical protein VIK85_00155 [Coriobacteriia bacterium]
MTGTTVVPFTGPRPEVDTQEGPPALRTYALGYAIGAIFLAFEIPLLGLQPKYAFDGVYLAAFALPPVLTAFTLLLVDSPGRPRTLPLRALVLFAVTTLASVVSTVLLTPLLVLMFREGVGRSLSATGAVSAVTLAVVAAPLVVELVAASRSRRLLHASVLVAGLAVTAVAFSMALWPTGPLASSMRLDQGELLMITSSWWLPVYALAAAFARRLGMA